MRAIDISRANVAFEMGYRAQDPCSEVPEDEGVLGATFRDRDHFEVTTFEIIYHTLQARFTILEHTLTLTRPFNANSAFEVIFAMARNLGVTKLKRLKREKKKKTKISNYKTYNRSKLILILICYTQISSHSKYDLES